MRGPSLDLLGDGVDVAEAALEWARAEDRGRAGGEAGGVEAVGREAIERPLMATLRLVVAADGMALGNEEPLDRVGIARRALEADDVPDIGHRDARSRHQHGAADRHSVGPAP